MALGPAQATSDRLQGIVQPVAQPAPVLEKDVQFWGFLGVVLASFVLVAAIEDGFSRPTVKLRLRLEMSVFQGIVHGHVGSANLGLEKKPVATDGPRRRPKPIEFG